MRTDVKLGVVISMVVVLVAGGYFVFSGNDAKPIDLAENGAAPALKEGQQKPPGGSQTADSNRRAPNLPNRNTRQQPNRPAGPVNAANPAGRNPATELAKTTRTPADDDLSSASPQPHANAPVNPVVNQPAASPTELAANAGSPTGQPAAPASNDPQAPASAAEALAAMRKAAAVEKPNANPTGTAAVDIHRAQPGDTFATLAQTYYGSTKYAAVLRQANPEVTDPSSIRVGTAIRIPSLPPDADRLADATPARTPAQASANTPTKPASGSRTYVVRPGDSFYKIAERELGKASRWKELLALNKSLVNGDPTRLRVGQKVTLPES